MSNRLLQNIDDELIFFIDHSTKEDVLLFLSDAISKKHSYKAISHLPDIHTSIMQREKLMSTGIGMGIAIPHAKIPLFPHFIVAIALLQQGIDWNAIDASLVRIVFMIVGPDDKPAEYLALLSQFTQIVRSETARRTLLNTLTKETVKNVFLN